MELETQILSIGKNAVLAGRQLALLGTNQKNFILSAMAEELHNQRNKILRANEKDMAAGRGNGLSPAMLDRLELTDDRIDGMITGLKEVIILDDPVGKELSSSKRPNGLNIKKVRVPIGVIGIIFESRPNVTCDAAALCFKSSNAVILRGGKEAIFSNTAIAGALQKGGARAGMPHNAIQLIPTTDRAAVKIMCQMVDCLDLIIPRGGESLIRAITKMAHVPVIKRYKGVCHTYIDDAADLDMAWDISENAKCQRPGVCNAMETLLVHQDIAESFLPHMAKVFEARGVEVAVTKKYENYSISQDSGGKRLAQGISGFDSVRGCRWRCERSR